MVSLADAVSLGLLWLQHLSGSERLSYLTICFYFLFARKQNGCRATSRSFAVSARVPDTGLLFWKGLQSSPWPVLLDVAPVERPPGLWEDGRTALCALLWSRPRFPGRSGEQIAWVQTLATDNTKYTYLLLQEGQKLFLLGGSVFTWCFLSGGSLPGLRLWGYIYLALEYNCSFPLPNISPSMTSANVHQLWLTTIKWKIPQRSNSCVVRGMLF